MLNQMNEFAPALGPIALDDADLETVSGGITPILAAVAAVAGAVTAGIALGAEVARYVRNHTAETPIVITD